MLQVYKRFQSLIASMATVKHIHSAFTASTPPLEVRSVADLCRDHAEKFALTLHIASFFLMLVGRSTVRLSPVSV